MSSRSPGQVLVSVPLSVEFLARIDNAYVALGYSDRAKFIRDAIKEKLEAISQSSIPTEEYVAPSRKGIGGAPTHRKYVISEGTHSNSETSVGSGLRDVFVAVESTPKPIGAMFAGQLGSTHPNVDEIASKLLKSAVDSVKSDRLKVKKDGQKS